MTGLQPHWGPAGDPETGRRQGRGADSAVSDDPRPLEEVLDVVQDLHDQVSVLDGQVVNLRAALQSNRRIGIALGIVMSQLGIGDEDAFAALRHVSQHQNRKLHDVAEDVIYAGRLDQ